MSEISAFESKHFVIHTLAEGVFAAIATNGGHAICNAGLIDLGGLVVVFDTFISPQAAVDLRRFALEQFGQAPQIVINSHYHNDHIWGNQVFAAEAQIISSVQTRQLIATEGMEEYKWYSSNSAQKLETLRTQYQNTQDKLQREELLLWMGEYGGVVEALPNLQVCLPNITFDDRLELHGARQTAQLTSFEKGHTSSDTILYLPQAGVIFTSDLLFVACHPYLGDGDPFELMHTLRELIRLDATCYVPGHGPVGTSADVKLLIEYIEGCIETAQTLVESGNANEERIKDLQISDRFRNWIVAQFYQTNIKFLCQRLSSVKAGTQSPG